MKKLNFTFITLLMSIAVLTSSCDYNDNGDDDQITPIPNDDIPTAVISYTDAYFPDESIVSAEYDKDGVEVLLSNGIQLEFNNAYEITSIDSETDQQLPDSVIPAEILDYVNTTYPGIYIVSWEKDGATQEVELSNDVSLTFDLYGNLISTDDDDQINNKELPAEVSTYVADYFPGETVSKAEYDDDGIEVTLSNGIELDFDNQFNITSISSENDQKLPDNVIPPSILDYINTNFPNSYIVSWEIEGKYQKVELNSDIDVVFDSNGQFVAVDID